jgi:hypothetical protein
VPLYVTARGLTTSFIPYTPGRGFQIDFDLLDHELLILASDGASRTLTLEPRPVADFYATVMRMLETLGLPVEVWTAPVEIPGKTIPFEKDYEHASYDAEQVTTFWRVLASIQPVFEQFRSEYLGKASPIHLFWGGLDLAASRFSGRDAPPHPGGAPNCGPHVMHEAYSHEVSSAGFWPGPDGEGSFYSYVYPEPAGFRQTTVDPAGARFDDQEGEFLLSYTEVRTSPTPEQTLLAFLRSTYAAAADAAGWDRAHLERRAQ